jgi:GTP-binding protein HflX
VTGADLLVHVVDGSDVNPLAQISAVRQVVDEVIADHNATPPVELLVVNKIDAADDLALAKLRRALPDAVFVSAHTGEGLDRLREKMSQLVEPTDIRVDVTIPYGRGDLVAKVHTDGGTRIKGHVPAGLAASLRDFVTD